MDDLNIIDFIWLFFKKKLPPSQSMLLSQKETKKVLAKNLAGWASIVCLSLPTQKGFLACL